MAICSIYPFTFLFPSDSSSSSRFRSYQFKRSFSSSRISVASSHSNAKILKSNRRSRNGEKLSPYDSDDDGAPVDEEDDDDWGSDDEFSDLEVSDADRRRLKSHTAINKEKGSRKHSQEEWVVGSFESEQSLRFTKSKSGIRSRAKTLEKRGGANSNQSPIEPNKLNSSGAEDSEGCAKSRFLCLSEELDIDERWFPLLDYLMTFGLKESHFIQMYERHMPCLQINVVAAQERLNYLLSVGVKQKDIRKILLRQPQILEYTVENNLRVHVAFLSSLGIPESRIGHIITATPSLFSYSVENSLKPTVRYLIEEVGMRKDDVSKVVQLSPQILVQRIDNTWNTRFKFLTRELGASRDSVVKMVTKHPQFLHYSIEDGLLPRINFLRSIGMRNSDILKVLTSHTQVFSLSLEKNLKPKYMYLINDLKNEVKALTKYPTYLSLSLDQRIRPRHRFLVALKKAPKGPFPLSSFVPTDECFCQQWAGTTLDKYLAFRQKLLLKQFAKKYEKR